MSYRRQTSHFTNVPRAILAVAAMAILTAKLARAAEVPGEEAKDSVVARASDLTVEDIYSNWDRRVQNYNSVKLSFMNIHSDEPDPEDGMEPSSDEKKPPKLVDGRLEYQATSQIWIDGARIRYVVDGQRRSGSGIIREKYTSCFDGRDQQSLFASNSHEFPSGFIAESPRSDFFCLLSTVGVRLCFCLHNDLGLRSKGFQLDPRHVEVNGRKCVILTTAKTQSDITELWVCPQMNYSVIKYLKTGEAGPRTQVDIEYELKSDGLWLPIKITSLRLGVGGVVGTSQVATLIDHDSTPTFHSDDFRITFPVGAIVTESRRGQERFYVQREDGKQREITTEELDQPYAELLNTDTGQAGRD